MTAPDVRRQAQELHASARAHKKAEFHHRKQARALMRQLDELRRECAARGITLEIDTEPGGPQS
jgi:hypothetical protein